MENKNALISTLQVWGILLVVLGHSFYYHKENNPVFDWIYTFHMPLFMFISGYLLKYGTRKHNKRLSETQLWGSNGFVWKKTRRLLIPYVTISSIAFIPKAMLGRFAGRPIDFSIEGYINMLVYPERNVIAYFWFLPTLFLILMFFMLAAKATKARLKPTAAWVVLLALMFLHTHVFWFDIRLFNVSAAIYHLVYFALGYISCTYNWERHCMQKPTWVFSVTAVLSIALLLAPECTGKDVLCAVNGIAMSVALAKIYVDSKASFLNHLYGASFAIYLFSWFPQVASQQMFIGLTHAPWWVGSILAFVSGVYVPLLAYRLIQRYKESKPGRLVAFLSGM